MKGQLTNIIKKWTIRRTTMVVCMSMGMLLMLWGCGGNRNGGDNDRATLSEEITALDTAKPIVADTAAKEKVEEEEPLDYSKAVFDNGIIPVIEETSPAYAAKLAASGQDGFLIVDKARMKVILYDRYGYVLKEYGMACSRNYGTKHKKGDNRTPEGFFSVQGVYDSTDWLYTDDNGRTSKKKGQFGPRFIRLSIPGIYSIGIHGTCAPWSIGHRASHGCIRLTNENILELVELVKPGMPVIVLPGKRDRQVNRSEGYDITYFPTDPNFKMSDKEKEEKVSERKEEKDSAKAPETKADSIVPAHVSEPAELPAEEHKVAPEVPDSIF